MKKTDFLKNRTFTLTFGGAHSLVAPHIPNKVDPEELSNFLAENTSKEAIENFGLFGGESQYNHFNPDVKAEDWNPKDEDFIHPMYRILSAGMVYKYGIPIDFGKQGVLRKAMSKLIGVTVYPDHKNTEVGNHFGVVLNVAWQKGYEQDGVQVPPGINGVLKIDAKSNPRIARGILMDPPAIHSGSTKVTFDWEKSHTELKDEEFFNLLGTKDKDGNLHRIVVTNVRHFEEYSLVSRGADPFAQKINEQGGINNPKFIDPTQLSYTDYKNFELGNSLSLSFDNPLTNTSMDEFSALIDSLPEGWNLSDQETPEDLFEAISTKVSELSKEVEKITSELEVANTAQEELQALREVSPELTVESLKSLMESLPSEEELNSLTKVEEMGGIEAVTAKVSNGEAHLNFIRQSAASSFKLIHGENAQEDIVNLILSSDLKAAKAFEQTYNAELEKVLPLKCHDCGGTDISRASHETKPSDTQSLSQEAEKENRARSRKPSDIHK